MNIVLVVFDSWRKDCAGVYGSPPWGEVHTPNFNRFAEEALVMTRAYPEVLPTIPVRRTRSNRPCLNCWELRNIVLVSLQMSITCSDRG